MKVVVAVSKNEVEETANVVAQVTNDLENAKKVLTTPAGTVWKNEDGSDYMKIRYIEDNIGDDGCMLVDVDIPEEISLRVLKFATKFAKLIYSAFKLFEGLAEEIESVLKSKKTDDAE